MSIRGWSPERGVVNEDLTMAAATGYEQEPFDDPEVPDVAPFDDGSEGPGPRRSSSLANLPNLISRKSQEFSLMDFEDTPAERMWLQPAQREAFQDSVRRCAQQFISLLDFDRALQRAQLKVADALCRAIEKARDNVEFAGGQVRAEIDDIERRFTGSDIQRYQLDRLYERHRMLAVQYRGFRAMFDALLDERQHQVDISGQDWPSYETLKQKAKSNARRREEQKQLGRFRRMNETEYRKWLKSQEQYEPQHNGIDAAADDRR